MQDILSSINYSTIANISLLCPPGTKTFFPLYSSDVIKIDDRLLELAGERDLKLKGVKTILLESSSVGTTVALDYIGRFRMISIKPGDAVHYIKKLQASTYIDLPSAFWQAEYQWNDKTFLMDECVFPHSKDSLIFKDIAATDDEVILKDVIISQLKYHCIRVFFTVNDIAMMVVAHKPGQDELMQKTVIQEVVILNADARAQYEDYYSALKKGCQSF